MTDVPLFDLLRQAIISTEKKMMALSDSSCKYCLETGRSTGAYFIFYKVGPINHVTHVPGPGAQSSSESEYN